MRYSQRNITDAQTSRAADGPQCKCCQCRLSHWLILTLVQQCKLLIVRQKCHIFPYIWNKNQIELFFRVVWRVVINISNEVCLHHLYFSWHHLIPLCVCSHDNIITTDKNCINTTGTLQDIWQQMFVYFLKIPLMIFRLLTSDPLMTDP